MTKSDYMQRLQEKLDSFGKELREEILEDYRQHFAEGELQGKTEEEIIEELGNIEDMIRELSEAELRENMGGELPAVEGPAQGSGKISGTDSAEDASERACGYGQGGVGTEGGSFFSYSGKYDRIILEGEEADIYVKPSEDEEVHVEYVNQLKNGQAKYEYYQHEENGIFYAGIRRRTKGQECRTGVEGDEKSWRVMLFGKTVVSYRNVGDGMNGRMLALLVSVPKGVSGLSAKSSAGDVHVHGLEQENVQLGSSSGDIKVEKVLADTMELHVSSGDVTVCETKCCIYLNADARSGDVNIQNVVLKEGKHGGGVGERELKVSSSSGDVDMQNVTAEKVKVSSSSGDVSMQNVTAAEAKVRSSSGDVGISNVSCSGEFLAESSSGDLSVQGVKSEAFTAASSSGDVSIASVEFTAGSVEASRGDLAMADLAFTAGEFRANSGDMALSNLRFGTGKFLARQGDIAILNTEFEAGSFAVTSGDIVGDNLSGEFGSFLAESGDIVLRNQNESCCKGYQCVAENGDISIESSAEVYECRSRSGDISVHASGTPRKLTIESSDGDVFASAKGTPESVSLQSKMGDVCLKLGQTEGMDVEIDAGGGDAYIKWDGQKRNVEKGRYTYGTGACKVKISSKGGDVVVSGFSD